MAHSASARHKYLSLKSWCVFVCQSSLPASLPASLRREHSHLISITTSSDAPSARESGILRQEVNDSELNFCFRKLAKKDTTTKVKALDELAALFALRSADELALVLPAWVRL